MTKFVTKTLEYYRVIIYNASVSERLNPGATLVFAREEYLSARAFAALPIIYGARGEIAAGAYAYFRWVDDVVDKNGSLTKQQKIEFINRQIGLHNAVFEEDIHPIEGLYTNLPWDKLSCQRADLARRGVLLLSTIKEDISHQGFFPRTHRQIRHYNIRTMCACIESVGLIINGRNIKPTKEFVDLLDHWNTLGSLSDFHEDVERKMLQVGFYPQEVVAIMSIPSIEGRKDLVLAIYNRQRFQEEKDRHLSQISRLARSFWDLDMPLYQKLICYGYMRGREPRKLQQEVRFPEEFSLS